MLLMCLGRPESSALTPDAASDSRRTLMARRTYASRPFRRVSSCSARRRNSCRVEDLERQVFELPLDLPDAQPLGQRGVDLRRLAGDAHLLVVRQRLDRAHVVQPIGELDEHDAQVLRHRQQHLADVLGLLLLVAAGTELGELRDPVDQLRDVGAEALLDVGEREVGVLGDVVQQCRDDGRLVEAHLGKDARHGQRM